MRSQKKLSYILEDVFKPQELFAFIQEKAKLSDYEMYETFNMGQDYALFVSKEDSTKTLKIIEKSGFKGIDAGFVTKGERMVEIRPRNITFDAKSLDLR